MGFVNLNYGVTLQSCIFVNFQQIILKLGNFVAWISAIFSKLSQEFAIGGNGWNSG